MFVSIIVSTIYRDSDANDLTDDGGTNIGEEKDEGQKFADQEHKKRKVWSDVWVHYHRKILLDKSVEATCKYCAKVYKYDSHHGTSKLKYHVDKSCLEAKLKMKKSTDLKQMLLKSGSVKRDGSMELENFRFDQELARIAFARAVIVHELPFAMAEYIFFRIFLKFVNPAFKVVSPPTLKEDCMKEYRKEKIKLYKALGGLHCRMSFTSDLWTSNQNKSYMALTCHYIDDKWKLKKRIIAFCLIEESHTGAVIAKEIQTRLFEWNLDRKIFSLALDNASSNNSAVKEMVKILRSKSALPLSGQFFHVRCVAHILNLVVQYGLEEFKEAIDKIRESVKFVKSSSQRQRTFNLVAGQVGAPDRMVTLDVSTRWNSTYKMLDVALLFKDAFSRYSQVDFDYVHEPSKEEWEIAAVFREFLKGFYDLTNLFSSVSIPTSNLYFSNVCELHLILTRGSYQVENLLLSSMCEKMLKKFNKYWHKISPLFAIASILDPQIKMVSIEYYYPLIYGDLEGLNKIDEVKNCLKDLYDEYASKSVSIGQSSSLESGSNVSNMSFDGCSSQISNASISSLFSTKFGLDRSGFHRHLEQASMSKPTKSDLDAYLDEGIHPSHEDFDILTWWKLNAPKYHVVSLMARDILAIPCTTVASESAFSTSGRILDQYRLSMHPSTVEALVCAQDWIRSDYKGDV